MDKVVVMGVVGVYNEFIEERGVVEMEVNVNGVMVVVSDVVEKVVLGVVEKSGKSVEEVVGVVYYMSCVDGEIEWDWCNLGVDDCMLYEKWVMEVCGELGVDLE
ncbi:hypothetical protein D3C75_439590 [compost metagenome]